MKNIKYNLASDTWNNEEIEAINDVIASNRYTMGDRVKTFETEFAKFFGSQYSIMVNSGSSANLLMIASLVLSNDHDLNIDDEVIVPSVSWSTTYYPVSQYNLKLVFVDINKQTLNIDVDKIKQAITNKTKAILAVNLLGNPNDFTKIQNLICERNIILLEDNCESLGASLNEKKAGTFGLMGTFSSFFSHHIATMEGGCVVTDDEEIYHILLSIRAHGWTRNLPKENMVSGIKSDDPFEEAFKFVLPGYNVRPLEMSGAIGIEQLKKLPSLIEVRRKNADFFVNLFSSHPFIQIQKEVGQSSWFGFSLVLNEKSPISRKALVSLLDKNAIECRPIVTGNFLKNTEVLEFFDYEVSGNMDSANLIDKNGLFVGNHHIDITENIKALHDLLSSIE